MLKFWTGTTCGKLPIYKFTICTRSMKSTFRIEFVYTHTYIHIISDESHCTNIIHRKYSHLMYNCVQLSSSQLYFFSINVFFVVSEFFFFASHKRFILLFSTSNCNVIDLNRSHRLFSYKKRNNTMKFCFFFFLFLLFLFRFSKFCKKRKKKNPQFIFFMVELN